MTDVEAREAFEETVRDVLQRAYLHGVVSVTHCTDPHGVPVGYPEAEAEPAARRVLEAADASAAESRGALARAIGAFPAEEPPVGSVVAIGWGQPRQEIWVSNSANVGNWYSPDIPMRGDEHPHWEDVLRRAAGRSLVLLVAGHASTYAAGWAAAIEATTQAVQAAIEELPMRPPARGESR